MKLSIIMVILAASLLGALGGYGYFFLVRPARALVAQAKPEASRKALQFAECLARGALPVCSDPLTTEHFHEQYPPELLDGMASAIRARYGAFRSARVDEQSFVATESRGPGGKQLEVSLRVIASFEQEPAVPVSVTLAGTTPGDLRVERVGVTP